MATNDADATEGQEKQEPGEGPTLCAPDGKRSHVQSPSLREVCPECERFLREHRWQWDQLISRAAGAGEPLRRELAKMERLHSERVRQLLLEAQRIAEPIQRWLTEVERHIAPRVQAVLRQLSAPRLAQWWVEFAERYELTQVEAASILRRYKWCVTPSLPLEFVFRVVDECRKDGRRDSEINALFVDHFAADDWQALQAMVDSWKDKPLLTKRVRVLRDCVGALQASGRAKFNAANVVLPTLITQVDGVLLDYLETKGVPRRKPYNYRRQEFRKYKRSLLDGPLEEAATFMVLEVLYQDTRGRVLPQVPLGFSRHRIMHGENVNYGRKAYVIRAFLALDYLAHLE